MCDSSLPPSTSFQTFHKQKETPLASAAMPSHAEEHSYTIETNRNCTVEVTNVTGSYYLINPKVHMESGFVFSPPQPTLAPNSTEVFSFTKDDNTASGAVGVMTYDLFSMNERRTTGIVAIMFSVPFDYNFYKNWLGLGIFECPRCCNKELFDFMYNKKDFSYFARCDANGAGLTYHGKKVDIRGCMNDEGRGIVKLEIYDRMG